jgi:hypothetical protein
MTPESGKAKNHEDALGAGRRIVLAGLFSNWAQASQAIHDLQAAAFPGEQIGVAMRDRNTQDALVPASGTDAVEAAASGAVGGGLLGALAGYLIAIGAIALPGIGPVVAGGALASALGLAGGTALAGAGIGAAAGGFVGMLIGLGLPDTEARHFETGVRQGGVLVIVKPGERAAEALGILARNGADLGPGIQAASPSEPRGEHLV